MGQFIETLQRLSTQFGSGDLMMDSLIIFVTIGGLIGVAAFLAWAVSRSPQPHDSKSERMDVVLGRLERTERTIHEFRSDVIRGVELVRADLEFLRGEVDGMKTLLEETQATMTVATVSTRATRQSREEIASRLSRAPAAASELVGSEFAVSQFSGPETVSHGSTGTQGNTGLLADTPNPQVAGVSQLGNESAPRSLVSTGASPEESPFPGATPASGAVAAGSTQGNQKPALTAKLERTRKGFLDRLRGVLGGKPKVDAEALDELEATLVGSDIGLKTIRELLADAKEEVAQGTELSEGGLKAILKARLLKILERGSAGGEIAAPRRITAPGLAGSAGFPVVILMVGVNGAGKTTTAAKLAHRFKEAGSLPLLVAADTFRAAAVEQLHEWGRRLGIEVVSGPENAKPQTVVHDGLDRAISDESVDVVIIDTAGRLHTKQSLMEELSGIRNIIQKQLAKARGTLESQVSADDVVRETLLVIDGSTGQNGLAQAREFKAASGVTGLVVTKLDGTSKGGILVAIKDELEIPVRYIGTGESQNDLEPFSPREFVEALFANG